MLLEALLWPLTAGITVLQYLVYYVACVVSILIEFLLWTVVNLAGICGIVLAHAADVSLRVISAVCEAAPGAFAVAGTWLLSTCEFLLAFTIAAAQFTWNGLSVAAEITWNSIFIVACVLFDGLCLAGAWLITGVVYTSGFLLTFSIAAAQFTWVWLLYIGSHSTNFVSAAAEIIWNTVVVLGGEGLLVSADFLMSLFTLLGHYLAEAIHFTMHMVAICSEYTASFPWADTSVTVLVVLKDSIVIVFTWTVVTPIQYFGWTVYVIFDFIFNLPWLDTMTYTGKFLYTWFIETPLRYISVIIGYRDSSTMSFQPSTQLPLLLDIFAVAALVIVSYALSYYLSKKLQERHVAQRHAPTLQREQVPDTLRHAPTERLILRSPVRLRTTGVLRNEEPIASDGSTHPPGIHVTVSQLTADLEREREKKLCVVCLDNKRELLLRPCNHFCLCSNCLRLIDNKCPVCRGNILYTERIYDS